MSEYSFAFMSPPSLARSSVQIKTALWPTAPRSQHPGHRRAEEYGRATLKVLTTRCIWGPVALRVFRHAIRNSLIPVITILGLQTGALMSGAVVTEQIFVVPGFGRLIVEAVFTRDYPLVQGVVLITASSYVLINLLVDLSYSLVNPRIRIGAARGT